MSACCTPHLHDVLQLGDMAEEDACKDKCVAEWLQPRFKGTANQRVPMFMDAYYANDIGSELAAMGMAEAAWEARNWSDGESTLVKNESFTSLVKHLATDVPIRFSWPVSAIIQHPQGAASTTDTTDRRKGSFVTVVGPAEEVCVLLHSFIFLALGAVHVHYTHCFCVNSI